MLLTMLRHKGNIRSPRMGRGTRADAILAQDIPLDTALPVKKEAIVSDEEHGVSKSESEDLVLSDSRTAQSSPQLVEKGSTR